MLRLWGSGTYPPSFAEVDGRYLSLADLFQVMTSALSEMHQTGKRPQSVRLAKVYGPLEITGGHGPNVGTVTAASVAKACATLADRLNDPAWKPLPNNIIPAGMTVEGIQMNAAQFLRLMAEALVAPSPETKLNVKMTYMYSEMSMVYPRSRPPVDQGATWTFKPAPMGPPAGQLSVSRSPGN
jgi:hypothetical protein